MSGDLTKLKAQLLSDLVNGTEDAAQALTVLEDLINGALHFHGIEPDHARRIVDCWFLQMVERMGA